MKFLELHTFYPPIIDYIMASAPNLSAMDYKAQCHAIIEQISGAHIISPYISELGYETFQSFPNFELLQKTWCLENRVTQVQGANLQHGIAKAQIETIKPDILYINDPISYDSRFIRSLSWRPSLIYAWRAASIPQETDFSEFDLLLTSSPLIKELLIKQGAKTVEIFFPGIPNKAVEKIQHIQKAYDVVFCGQCTPEHKRRQDMLSSIARHALNRNQTDSLGFFISCANPTSLPQEILKFNKGPRWGIDMLKAQKSGRIAFNSIIDMGRGEVGNMRLFETTGAGSFVLTEASPRVQELFIPGEEVETYSSEAELLEKIDYYIEHSREREEIALRGHIRCLKNYSLRSRMQDLHSIFQKHLKAKTAPLAGDTAQASLNAKVEQTSIPDEKIVNNAILAIEEGKIDHALDLARAAASTNPPLQDANYVLGLCLLKKGLKLEALEAFVRERQVYPESVAAKCMCENVERSLRTT